MLRFRCSSYHNRRFAGSHSSPRDCAIAVALQEHVPATVADHANRVALQDHACLSFDAQANRTALDARHIREAIQSHAISQKIGQPLQSSSTSLKVLIDDGAVEQS